MWKVFKKIKDYLAGNFYKHFKKIVERTGIWLIALLNISIPVLAWLCEFIAIPVLSIAAFAAYVVTIEYMCFGIGRIFKNGNNGQSLVPQ